MLDTFEKIRKYNLWDKKSVNLGFERTSYLSKVSKYIDNKLIKVLLGQRRVGKSYLLRQIIDLLVNEKSVNPHNIFYLNKEYTAFNSINNSGELEELFNFYKRKSKVKGKIYLFLDEIQNIKNRGLFVNSYSQDFSAEFELFITGSNSRLLAGELAGFLSGRYVGFIIHPFSLTEAASFKNKIVDRNFFLDYLQEGGLPELYNLTDEEMRLHYIESLKNTIVLRDIVSRYNIKGVVLLEQILRFALSSIASLTSISSIVNYFKSKQKKTNYETVSSYINYLTEMFIINKSTRYNLKGGEFSEGRRNIM